MSSGYPSYKNWICLSGNTDEKRLPPLPRGPGLRRVAQDQVCTNFYYWDYMTGSSLVDKTWKCEKNPHGNLPPCTRSSQKCWPVPMVYDDDLCTQFPVPSLGDLGEENRTKS